MKRPGLYLTICILMLASMVSSADAQGLYWEQTVTAPGMEKEIHSKGVVMPMKLKTTSDDEGEGVIIRSDKEIIYVVNGKEKTYSEMTFKEFEAQMSQMGEKMKELQEQMKGMSPEERKMFEGMMGGMGQEKDYTIKRTKEKKKVAGYSCEKVLLLDGAKEMGEFWITKDIGSMKEFAKDWVKLMGKMVQGPMAKAYRKIAELDGFAMETKLGGMTSTTTKLEKRAIKADEFELPAGYKKVEMQKMDMGDDEE